MLITSVWVYSQPLSTVVNSKGSSMAKWLWETILGHNICFNISFYKEFRRLDFRLLGYQDKHDFQTRKQLKQMKISRTGRPDQ